MTVSNESNSPAPFWQTKKLRHMSRQEWESLCDGCGKCCLHKLQDADTDEIFPTNVACRLLDVETCRCTDYSNRKVKVPDCVQLSPKTAGTLNWLPSTCAYRLIANGEDLPHWHPLVSGDSETVHVAGVSVRGRAVSETEAGPLGSHLVD
ncbi:MAG: YcgN family cysteine cluster protein [Rhodospirillaceae bacterium]|nr:YcgN family cysteine cluster protein [Rhodospirillaceae bacterium]